MVKLATWRFLYYCCFAMIIPTCVARKHTFKTTDDSRFIIAPIGHPFGFLKGGEYRLEVGDFGIRDKITENDHINDIHPGFVLKRFVDEKEFTKTISEILESNGQKCIFQNLLNQDNQRQLGEEDTSKYSDVYVDKGADGILVSMKSKEKTWGIDNNATISHEFTIEEEGLYMLIYQICCEFPDEANPNEEGKEESNQKPRDLRSHFHLDITHINYDIFGTASYLTAGELPLPRMFLYFAFSYFLLLGIWVANIRNVLSGGEAIGSNMMQSTDGGGGLSGGGVKSKVYIIHHMMAVLLFLKVRERECK